MVAATDKGQEEPIPDLGTHHDNNIMVGKIDEAAEEFCYHLQSLGAPESKAQILRDHWLEFILSDQGKKFRWRHK